jgi:hypothetical protein
MDEDQIAFDSFLLAMRVMYVAFELDEPATKFERPFEMLRDIANGQVTLTSPGEMGVKFPALKELIYDASSKVIERDRANANRVLRGLARM